MTAITLNLADDARALIEDWVRAGHYASVEEVVEAGIQFVQQQVEAGRWQPSPDDLAKIEQGLADVDAGRLTDIDIVREKMRARFAPGL